MAVENLTDAQLDARLQVMERLIAEARDVKSLPAYNSIVQKLIDEQVRRDLNRIAGEKLAAGRGPSG